MHGFNELGASATLIHPVGVFGISIRNHDSISLPSFANFTSPVFSPSSLYPYHRHSDRGGCQLVFPIAGLKELTDRNLSQLAHLNLSHRHNASHQLMLLEG